VANDEFLDELLNADSDSLDATEMKDDDEDERQGGVASGLSVAPGDQVSEP